MTHKERLTEIKKELDTCVEYIKADSAYYLLNRIEKLTEALEFYAMVQEGFHGAALKALEEE